MTNTELRRYWSVYDDCWKLFKKYSNLDPNDALWDEIVMESRALHIKHGEIELAKKVILSTLDEIEKIWEGKRGVEK